MPKTFTTIYRTGGTERCEWRKCAPVATRAEADALAASIVGMGYRALVHETAILESLGMPEGWNTTQAGE